MLLQETSPCWMVHKCTYQLLPEAEHRLLDYCSFFEFLTSECKKEGNTYISWNCTLERSLLNYAPCVLKTNSCTNVPYVLTCSHANVPCMLTCQCALHAYVLTCLACLCAHMPCIHVPCILTYSCVNVPSSITLIYI